MSGGVSLQADRDRAQSIAKLPLIVRGFRLAGQLILTGPNTSNPELLDAAVLYTDIRLNALDPTKALAIIAHAINEANLDPVPWLSEL